MAIISFSNMFIFVKTMKTAGTALEVHLERCCAPQDIVTPITPAIDGHVPRNWAAIGELDYYNHMTAREIRSRIGPCFDNFFSFCFERHPVDKCISHYAMLRNSPYHKSESGPKSWEDYLDRGNFPVDTSRYTDDDGTMLVNRVYRYERMDEALLDVSGRLSVALPPLTVRAKHEYRYGVPSFDDVMADGNARNRIFDAFEQMLRFVPY